MTTLLLSASDSMGILSDALNFILDNIWWLCMGIAGTACAVWGLVLGILYMKSGADEQKRKLSKSAIIAYVVGIFIIFAVATATPLIIDALTDWREEYRYAVSFIPM